MTFALVGFRAAGARREGAQPCHGDQIVELKITAAATDVAYDFATTGGTFWTAAVADATYGGLATQARAFLLNRVAGVVAEYLGACSEVLDTVYTRVAGAPGAATEYRVTVSYHMPSLAFNAAGGPTAITVRLQWRLVDGQEPLVLTLGS